MAAGGWWLCSCCGFGDGVCVSGLVPLPQVMAEHRTYLPSIGLFAVMACLLDRFQAVRGSGPAGLFVAPS